VATADILGKVNEYNADGADKDSLAKALADTELTTINDWLSSNGAKVNDDGTSTEADPDYEVVNAAYQDMVRRRPPSGGGRRKSKRRKTRRRKTRR
jgi:hypothetical protein